jgi:SAM-dependent methyltransferase
MDSNFDTRDQFGNFEVNILFLQQAIELDRRMKILEIGSGKGNLLYHYHQRGYDIVGIDIDDAMIAESKRLYGQLPLYKMSGDMLSFDDSSFDVVLGFDVFEHIRDSDRHLQEIRRILKPGGYYLLQTPNKWTNVIFETIRWKSVSKWRSDHCSLHNYWQLKRRFEKNGFEIQVYSLPVVTDFFKLKIRTYVGPLGLLMLKAINPDKFPLPLKTNFYVKAQRINSAGQIS